MWSIRIAKRDLSTLSATLFIAGLSTTVSVSAATPERATNTVIEDVVVTAQRVEENMQRVPIAVSAYGAETLWENRMNAMVDIAQRIAELYRHRGQSGEPNLAIRGIGTGGHQFQCRRRPVGSVVRRWRGHRLRRAGTPRSVRSGAR
ncbi:MAG: hypothetical protein R3E86_00510 [Pseudomonadales bacterium]